MTNNPLHIPNTFFGHFLSFVILRNPFLWVFRISSQYCTSKKKCVPMKYQISCNMFHHFQHLGKQWTVIARAASLYTDPFILMSGLLTTISFLRHLDRRGTIDLPKEFISRFVRYVYYYGKRRYPNVDVIFRSLSLSSMR